MEGHSGQVDSVVRRASLTPFQTRLISRFATGVTLKEIAKEEYVSLRKVKYEMEIIHKKLGVPNTVASIMVAHDMGYISHPDADGIVHSQTPFSSSP